MNIKISIDPKVKAQFPDLSLATVMVRSVNVEETSSHKLQIIMETVNNLRNKFTDNIKDNSIIRAYRNFYWRLKVDPTKQRPASEALLRRVIKGFGLPSINNVVDACNLASVETLIPIGLYDYDKVEGELTLRFAHNGELFKPIGGKYEVLTSNQIVLSDSIKILHVYPFRDSIDAMITKNTRNVLVVSCGAPKISKELIIEAAVKTSKYIQIFAGGFIGEVAIIE
jgi:DNA/RNA-binding domain of Phe-tRNA-synthetase-like protein